MGHGAVYKKVQLTSRNVRHPSARYKSLSTVNVAWVQVYIIGVRLNMVHVCVCTHARMFSVINCVEVLEIKGWSYRVKSVLYIQCVHKHVKHIRVHVQ